jgi:lipoprotein-releasing system permease protein
LTLAATSADAPPEPTGTRPFAAFEWLLAWRYLRARRKEGFISVIAGFSFVGILLGVMTLIIVMAVMNGFRKELLSKILGVQRPHDRCSRSTAR